MLSRSDGKDYFHANLSSRVMISDRDFFRRFVNKGKESYQQEAGRKWDREAVRSLQLLQWCSCLICKGNTAKPHISLWKSEWRFSAREWKPPICEFPSADKDSPTTRTRNIPEECGENSKSKSPSNGAKKCLLFCRQNAGSWPRQFSFFFNFFLFGQGLLIIDLWCYPSSLSLPLLSRKFRLLDLAVHTYDFY